MLALRISLKTWPLVEYRDHSKLLPTSKIYRSLGEKMHDLPRSIGAISEFGRKGRVTRMVRFYRVHCQEQVASP